MALCGLCTACDSSSDTLAESSQLSSDRAATNDGRGAKGDEVSPREYTYADIQGIWDQKCTACHTGEDGYPAASLVLSQGESLSSLIGVYSIQADMTLIEPGVLESSYLWYKINGTQYDIDGQGDIMPPSYMPDEFRLTEQELTLIQAWITQGAGEQFTLPATEVQVDPDVDPVDEDPNADPTDEDPAEEDPNTDPADEDPSADPADEDPNADPADEDPSADPADEDPVIERTVSYAEVQSIYDDNCTRCHNNSGLFGPSGSLVLTSGDSYDATVNVSSNQQRQGMFLIAPGSLEDSYLWHKINDTHRSVGGSGGGMAPGFFGYNRMSDNEIDTIATWILEGALSDAE